MNAKTVRWMLLCAAGVWAMAACSLIEQPSRSRQPTSTPPSKTPPPASQPPPVETPPPVQETPPPRPRPAAKAYRLNAASQSLVAQARAQAAKGDIPMATASVERALRIEPDNPLVWLELGKIQQASGNYPQAEHTARKALSLSTGDLKAQATAWQAIARALRARGKVEEALAADAKASALTPD